MDLAEFHPYGASHLAALALTAVAGISMVGLHKSPAVPERWKHGASWILAVLLVVTALADPVLTWLRGMATDGPELAANMVHEGAWPLHLCDVAAFICAVALIQRKQRLAELAYLWGTAGTGQGLLTPNLVFEWWRPEFWTFFIQHGGVPVAGLTLVCGMGLAPQPGAIKRAISWGIVYLLVAGLANILLAACFPGIHPNYGFVCAKPAVGSLLDFLGPWPWYLPGLVIIAMMIFYLLCLPWSIRSSRSID